MRRSRDHIKVFKFLYISSSHMSKLSRSWWGCWWRGRWGHVWDGPGFLCGLWDRVWPDWPEWNHITVQVLCIPSFHCDSVVPSTASRGAPGLCRLTPAAPPVSCWSHCVQSGPIALDINPKAFWKPRHMVVCHCTHSSESSSCLFGTFECCSELFNENYYLPGRRIHVEVHYTVFFTHIPAFSG